MSYGAQLSGILQSYLLLFNGKSGNFFCTIVYFILVKKTICVSLTEYKVPGVAFLYRFIISRGGLRMLICIQKSDFEEVGQ